MRKSTFNILFYGKRSAVKANGKMPIMGRITVNGQAVQFGAIYLPLYQLGDYPFNRYKLP